MTENKPTSAGFDKLGYAVLDLSNIPSSEFERTDKPLPNPLAKPKHPQKFNTGDLVWNMRDAYGQDSVHFADQTLSLENDKQFWTGAWRIGDGKPQARGGSWYYAIAPERHANGGTIDQAEEYLVLVPEMRQTGWEVEIAGVEGGRTTMATILESRIEQGEKAYRVRYNINDVKWVWGSEIRG